MLTPTKSTVTTKKTTAAITMATMIMTENPSNHMMITMTRSKAIDAPTTRTMKITQEQSVATPATRMAKIMTTANL